MRAEKLSVRLDVESQQCMEELRSSSGADDASLLGDAIRLLHRARIRRSRKMRAHETLLDLLVRHGLVGKHHGLPRDLSTNRKHMRGFGES